MVKKAPIFVSIDTPDLKAALKIASDVKDFVEGIKLGPIFYAKNSLLEGSNNRHVVPHFSPRTFGSNHVLRTIKKQHYVFQTHCGFFGSRGRI